jgi:ribosome-binding factor A
MARAYARSLRVAAELHQLLSELLRTEVKDPRLEDVRINEVQVSGDLGVAKVYFGTLDPDADASAAEQALKRATGFLRSRVSRELRLRRAPELRFVHDEAALRGFRLTQLIEGTASPGADAAGDSAEADDEP